uniref:Aurora kinase n=1 Tax=Parastrongyloides trichosuri TaxID=131310 RepID=A0A0N4ZFC7_PARTI
MSMDEFEVGYPLGKGGFGSVFLVRLKADTRRLYALKIMYKSQLEESNLMKQLANEINIQQKLNHPHIAKLQTWWKTDERFFLLMDYCHYGCLFQTIQKGPLDEGTAFKIFKQVVDAVHFCHQNNIIHRDIKPENILFWKKDHIKLTDFGWSASFNAGQKNQTYCGTLEYMCPEIICNCPYDYRVDNWALGVLLYEMAHGMSPFAASDERSCEKRIMRLDIVFNNDSVSRRLKTMVLNLLKKVPAQRMSLSDVLKDLNDF